MGITGQYSVWNTLYILSIIVVLKKMINRLLLPLYKHYKKKHSALHSEEIDMEELIVDQVPSNLLLAFFIGLFCLFFVLEVIYFVYHQNMEFHDSLYMTFAMVTSVCNLYIALLLIISLQVDWIWWLCSWVWWGCLHPCHCFSCSVSSFCSAVCHSWGAGEEDGEGQERVEVQQCQHPGSHQESLKYILCNCEIKNIFQCYMSIFTVVDPHSANLRAYGNAVLCLKSYSATKNICDVTNLDG